MLQNAFLNENDSSVLGSSLHQNIPVKVPPAGQGEVNLFFENAFEAQDENLFGLPCDENTPLQGSGRANEYRVLSFSNKQAFKPRSLLAWSNDDEAHGCGPEHFADFDACDDSQDRLSMFQGFNEEEVVTRPYQQ